MTGSGSRAGMLAPARSEEFRAWWRIKLAGYRRFLESPVVAVDSLDRLSDTEWNALAGNLDTANMALYQAHRQEIGRDDVLALGRQFGLERPDRNLCAEEDAVTEITVRDELSHRRYIPYTTRALSWHTDGCYNDNAHAVRAFILHCAEQAHSGGENALLDPEILLGLLKNDQNINADALFSSSAFTIPANLDGEQVLRAAYSGAVFSATGGQLHTRFSARQRHIEWSDDAELLTAVEAIRYYLNHSPLVLSVRLKPGMGLIARNVLHTRNAFVDARGTRRLVYRARYFDPLPQPLQRSRCDAVA